MRYIESYTHNNRIGVLIELDIGGGLSIATEEVKELAADLAMQIAASNPTGIDTVDAINVAPLKFQLNAKLHDELPLLQQAYIRNTTILVKQRIESISGQLKVPIRVVRFSRYSVDDT